MKRAWFRFYAELNDFLPPERRMTAFRYEFRGRQTVKHLIESAGVPHTEVDLVLVNGRSVAFSHFVEDGDRVSVYPMFETLDVAPVTRVRPRPLRCTRFIADAHLGRLAAYLRMLGFDTLYRNDYRDEELSRIAASERRILLTRDRGLLKRGAVTHGCLVRESEPRRQLAEIVRRFDLAGAAAPFTRCLRCNTLLEAVEKHAVLDRVPPRSREHCGEFRRCPGCARVFWSGSHYRRMTGFIERVLASLGEHTHGA